MMVGVPVSVVFGTHEEADTGLVLGGELVDLQ